MDQSDEVGSRSRPDSISDRSRNRDDFSSSQNNSLIEFDFGKRAFVDNCDDPVVAISGFRCRQSKFAQFNAVDLETVDVAQFFKLHVDESRLPQQV